MENAAKELSVPFQEAESQDRLAVVSKVDIMLIVTSYFDIVFFTISLTIVSLNFNLISDRCSIVAVTHTKHFGVDDGKFFHFPKALMDSMVGSNEWNGTTHEITRKDMKGSQCWEGTVTVFDMGTSEAHGRRDKDYKAGQWAAGDVLQLRECGATCAITTTGKSDLSHFMVRF